MINWIDILKILMVSSVMVKFQPIGWFLETIPTFTEYKFKWVGWNKLMNILTLLKYTLILISSCYVCASTWVGIICFGWWEGILASIIASIWMEVKSFTTTWIYRKLNN